MGVREDQHLLFGLLALQNNFVSQADLLAAFGAWVGDKSTGLDELFQRRGVLNNEDCNLLQRLCDQHMNASGGSATATLAKLSVDTSVREKLEQFADTDLVQSVAQLKTLDPLATQSINVVADRSGRFSYLRPLDRGGLGVISVALDRELNREVALKQIREDRADEEAYRHKFTLEAEVTGGLEHPGIVPVYAFGNGPDGRPYYAMRLIRGDNLRQHISEFHDAVRHGQEPFNGSRLRQLVRRFLDVCDAVAYAHSRGVLHRDLKPANVMVGKFGETLLVDWGLAKTIGKEAGAEQNVDTHPLTSERFLTPSGSDANLTIHGQAVGTAAYAAPEQIAGKLHLIDERSDVYGLGAILYEILTGSPPINGDSTEEIAKRAVRNKVKSPREIQPAIPKGIISVCMKALAGQPDDRYRSATDLRLDVEAWLDDEPLAASPDSPTSRMARWLRKNRAFAGATAAGLLLISTVSLAFAVTFNSQKLTAERLSREARLSETKAVVKQSEAEQAAKERDKALDEAKVALKSSQLEAATSARLSQFVTGIFQANDPIGIDSVPYLLPKRSTAELTLANALEMGAQRMHEELGDEPLVLASVMQVIGNAYRSLGRYQDAITLMRESLTLRRQHDMSDMKEMSVSLQNLGLAELEAGDFAAAEEHILDAMELSRSLEDNELAIADCQFYLAWIKGQSYRIVEGEKLLRECFETRRRLLGIDHRKTRFAQLGLAFCLLEQGRIADASGFAFMAGTSLRSTESENPIVHVVNSFIKAQIQAKLFGAAVGEGQMRSVLQQIESELGKDSIYCGLVRFELACLIDKQGRTEEAAKELATCWIDAKRLTGLRHPKLLIFARYYSKFLQRNEQEELGAKILKEYWQAQQGAYGEHSELAQLAEFEYLEYRQPTLSPSEYWEEVDALVNRLFEHPNLSRESLQYAELLGIHYGDGETAEDHQKAEEVYSKMWDHLETTVAKSDSDWGLLASSRIKNLVRLNQIDTALECYEAVVPTMDNWADTAARRAQESFYLQASRLLIKAKRLDEALNLLVLRRDLWVTDGDELYYIGRDAARAFKAAEDQEIRGKLRKFGIDAVARALANGFRDKVAVARDETDWKDWSESTEVAKLLAIADQ